MHSLATRKDLFHLKTLKVIFDFYKSCIDDYSVWPNLLVHVNFSESHIFIFQDTFDSEAKCEHVQSFKDPPFKRCLYNGSYVRNGRLLHQCFLRHILISSG